MTERGKWHNSELRAMANFMHDFLKGRFDVQLKRVMEREKAKTQPNGNVVWTYFGWLQQEYDKWDLGQCEHSYSACQTKWSKYLQIRVHEIEGFPPEKALYIYFKLGTKLGTERAQRISQQYPGYSMIWRDGVLKEYHKKVNLVVETRRAEKESEEKRKKANEASTSRMNKTGDRGRSGERKEGGTRRSLRLLEDSPSKGVKIEDSSDEDFVSPRGERARGRDGAVVQPQNQKSQRAARSAQRRTRIAEEEAEEARKRKEEEENLPLFKDTSREKEPIVKQEMPDMDEMEEDDGESNLGVFTRARSGFRPVPPPPKRIRPEPVEDQSKPSEEQRPTRGSRQRATRQRNTVAGGEEPMDEGERREEQPEGNNASTMGAATPLVHAATAATATGTSPAAAAAISDDISVLAATNTTMSAESMEEMWTEMERREEGEERGRRSARQPATSNSSVPRKSRFRESGDTVAGVYDEVASRFEASGGFLPVDDSQVEVSGEAAAAAPAHDGAPTEGVSGEEGKEAAPPEEGDGIDSQPSAATAAHSRRSARLLRRRPTPADLVARLDRPGRQPGAVAGVSLGFKQRSRAGQNALKQAAADVRRPATVPQEKEAEEIVAAVPAAGSDESGMQPVETADSGKQLNAKEKLLEKMKKRRMEMAAGVKVEGMERLAKFLDPTERLMDICKTREASALFVTSQKDVSETVSNKALEDACKERRTEEGSGLADAEGEMDQLEDPEVREARRRRLCQELALCRLEEAVESALADDSLWV